MTIAVRNSLCVLCVCIGIGQTSRFVTASDDAENHQRAVAIFRESDQLCRDDNGQLWGVSLAGPVMLVDPTTRAVFANQADAEGQLTWAGGIYVGSLPPDVPMANTALKWAGVHWTQLLCPLPDDADSRRVLLMHESWHRVQDQIGLPASNPTNGHLNTYDGRYWLQLEWRALRRALRETSATRREAIVDALLFRRERHRLVEAGAAEECALEAAEGLAEYTGVRLSGMDAEKRCAYVAQRIDEMPNQLSTFNRSFAYLTGPAYGLLLDTTEKPWRAGLTPKTDLAQRLQDLMEMELPAASGDELARRAERYEGNALRQAETERETARRARHAELKRRFFEDAVLMLPLDRIQLTFDPRNVEALEGLGSYYPTLTISDRWGTLSVTQGALVTADFKRVMVKSPTDSRAVPLSGEGWTLELNASWQVIDGDRAGCYSVAPVAK